MFQISFSQVIFFFPPIGQHMKSLLNGSIASKTQADLWIQMVVSIGLMCAKHWKQQVEWDKAMHWYDELLHSPWNQVCESYLVIWKVVHDITLTRKGKT